MIQYDPGEEHILNSWNKLTVNFIETRYTLSFFFGWLIEIGFKMTGTVRINVTFRRVRVTIVAVEKK